MDEKNIINELPKTISEASLKNEEKSNNHGINKNKDSKTEGLIKAINNLLKNKLCENLFWMCVHYNTNLNYVKQNLKYLYNFNIFETKFLYFKEVLKQDLELCNFLSNNRLKCISLNHNLNLSSEQSIYASTDTNTDTITKNSSISKCDDYENKYWTIHKRIAKLYAKYGKSFKYYIADLIDYILGGYHKNYIIQEIYKSLNRKRDKLGLKTDLSIIFDIVENIKIGNEPVVIVQNFIKQKLLLASIAVDITCHDEFVYLYKELNRICHEKIKGSNEKIELTEPTNEEENFNTKYTKLDTNNELKSLIEINCNEILEEIKKIVASLPVEINYLKIVKIWILLDKCDFEHLEYIFIETRNLSIVRPNFYEELDKAYRETKKLLKLLIKEFESANEFIEFIKSSGVCVKRKLDIIKDYLEDILMVYTHHHFVVKHFHRLRLNLSKQELVEQTMQWRSKINNLVKDNQKLRSDLQKAIIERDTAYSELRKLRSENQELMENLQKLEPEQVKKSIQALECKLNQLLKEKQMILEENAELYTHIRKLESENKDLSQKLRELRAIPQENKKSIAGLLEGKRVVIFGGVSRDHYKSVLEEAGVRDEDYEWYEGYHTISLARSAEIVKRCDVVVVITSYAGHLHTWQTRSVIQPHQTLLLIHSSGAGSLRQQILEKFKKNS